MIMREESLVDVVAFRCDMKLNNYKTKSVENARESRTTWLIEMTGPISASSRAEFVSIFT